jgi:L-histidine Nalpha-methyltransferase / hercynylcysteine S-oxide synthase
MAIETVLKSTPSPFPNLGKVNFTSPQIVDIRQEKDGYSLLEDIKKGLRPVDDGEKKLPTLLLYDENGLRLFERITYLEEYYLTGTEIEILETYAVKIAERVPSGSIVVELGSG